MMRRLIALGTVSLMSLLGTSAGSATSVDSFVVQPNIIVILSDDQSQSIFNRTLMPSVFSRLADQGVVFDNFYDTSSVCCPSRAEFFTGLYEHHNGVDENSESLAGPTLPQAIQDSGYRTALIGKYLNSWPCRPRPEFDAWSCVASGKSGYTLVDPWINDAGTWHQVPGYQPQLLADRMIDFIGSTPDDQPFFAVYAPTTPHLPANGPPYHTMPVTPYRPFSYDQETRTLDTPIYLRRFPLTQANKDGWDGQHRNMTRAVRALDDQVGRILDAVDATGRTQDTLVIYWSDNGYAFGEHRRTWKGSPFEESVHVPMVIRFPSIHPTDAPLETSALAENVDLPATIAAAAGIPWGADGRSLLPILDGSAASVRDAVLIERCTGTKGLTTPCKGQGWYPSTQTTYPRYEGIVTGGYKYVRYPFTNEHQLFDLTTDPYEMTNLADQPGTAGLQASMDAQLNGLLASPVPDTTIVTGPSGPLTTRRATFTYFTQSRTATFWCRVTRDGTPGPWFGCDDGSTAIGGLTDGSYLFEVTGTDEFGTTDPAPATRSFSVSSTGPAVDLTSTPPTRQRTGDASLGFASPVADATFECRLNGLGAAATWSVCDATAGVSYSGLAAGQWNFEVRATDPATGETTNPPAAWMFTIDTTGPSVHWASYPAPHTSSTSALFRFVPTEATKGSITCQLGKATSVDCSNGSVSLSNLTEGWHTLTVRLRDDLSNLGTAVVGWRVDLTPPNVSITSAPPPTTTAAVPVFHLAMNEGGQFLCALDSWPPIPCKQTPEIPALASGPHTLVVTAWDEAGNISAPVSWSWIIS